MFVEIEIQRCVGCGLCENTHPDIFTMGKRYATVVQPIIPDDRIDAVKKTVEECPAVAIITTTYP